MMNYKLLLIVFLCVLGVLSRMKMPTKNCIGIPMLILLGLLLSGAVIIGGCQTKELNNQRTEEPTTPLTSNIQQLITNLGSDDWPTREKVQEELTEIGDKLIQEYRILKLKGKSEKSEELQSEIRNSHSAIKTFADALREATKSTDQEIRMRTNQIRKYFYCLLQPRIIFISNLNGNNLPFGGIYAINTDGSNQTRLTNNANVVGNMAWSPDGSRIAFALDGFRGIYVMNADGSNQTKLTTSVDWEPTWSPDGTKIAFASNRDGNWRIRDGYWQIYVMNADGSNQTRLTDNSASEWSPAWNPDGTKIAFESTRDHNNEIYVMDADGTHRTRLTNDSAIGEKPAWSPDGSKIAFMSTPSYQDGGNYDVYVMNANGSNRIRLTSNPAWDGYPTWSPDGTKIAFASDRDGDSDIYVMNADGSNVIRLTNGGYNIEPSWSPSLFPELSVLFTLRDEGFAEEEKKE